MLAYFACASGLFLVLFLWYFNARSTSAILAIAEAIRIMGCVSQKESMVGVGLKLGLIVGNMSEGIMGAVGGLLLGRVVVAVGEGLGPSVGELVIVGLLVGVGSSEGLVPVATFGVLVSIIVEVGVGIAVVAGGGVVDCVGLGALELLSMAYRAAPIIMPLVLSLENETICPISVFPSR